MPHCNVFYWNCISTDFHKPEEPGELPELMRSLSENRKIKYHGISFGFILLLLLSLFSLCAQEIDCAEMLWSNMPGEEVSNKFQTQELKESLDRSNQKNQEKFEVAALGFINNQSHDNQNVQIAKKQNSVSVKFVAMPETATNALLVGANNHHFATPSWLRLRTLLI